jgi:hypothetical protein
MFKNEIVYLPLAEVKKNEFATNENGIHKIID